MTDDTPATTKIMNESPRLGLDDRFTFHCGADLDCFTCCCSDVAIVLTPYDVLRLRSSLGMNSSEFLKKYTITPFTKEQKLPVVLLKMDPQTKRCPFVDEKGCGVYRDRPWACRMYPLGVADPKSPTPEEKTFYFLLQEQQCHGHGTGRDLSVREWISDQGIEDYDMMGAAFRDLMLHDFWDKNEALPPEKIEMYYTACYDLDRFRRFVFDSSFLEKFEVDEARVEALREDDEELLEFGMQWLRFSLFGERTMRVRPGVMAAARDAAPRESDPVAER